jgi:hypothetical protein
MRWGMVTGARVARRTLVRCSICARRSKSRAMRAVLMTEGSPPETMTSVHLGVCLDVREGLGSSASIERAPPPSPTMRERVQKRQ